MKRGYDKDEDEFESVSRKKQLDWDGGKGSDALEGGDDTEDLDDYRDPDGPVWEGPPDE